MKFARRQFLRLAAGAATALPVSSRIASAQAYPTRPVRIVVGFAAGTALDITARIAAQWLSERLGQPVIVDNRPGAGGNIGTESVIKSPPDGYTLLLASVANPIGAAVFEKLNFDFIRDTAPITSIARAQLVIVVNPSSPASSLADFIARAKANPGKINYGSNGSGSVTQIAAELFKQMTGVEMTHVPYRGGAGVLADLIGGQVDVVFDAMSSVIGHIRAGRLRALAVTAATRSDTLPGIPTVGEVVPGYEVTVWNGLAAPKGTPPEIIDRLNREVNAALVDAKVTARLADLGYTVFPSSVSEFSRLIVADTEKWGKVVKLAGIKPE
jgi:tripartite-type tricarboxylate transporter receptor subunit TctC